MGVVNMKARSEETSLPDIVDPVARRLLLDMSDVTLAVDAGGLVTHVSPSKALDDERAWHGLVGRRWRDVVLPDSRGKVDQLLKEARARSVTSPREINLDVDGVGRVPMRFVGAQAAQDRVVAVGRDLRVAAALQQQIVSTQQALDLEYQRLRQADIRYRVLFHVSAEGVLVVRGEDRVIVEANPAASSLLDRPPASITGAHVDDLFGREHRDRLLTTLGAVESGATRKLTVAAGPGSLELSISSFRQAGVVYFLVRVAPEGAPTLALRDSRLLRVLELLPEGFVVTDHERRILAANVAFCEMVSQPSESQLVGQPIDRWFGRSRVDLNIVLSNLKEHGVVRNFGTIVRGEFGTDHEVAVTAVAADDESQRYIGFVLRRVGVGARAPLTSSPFQARSLEQLRELVGRMPLKDIVRESSEAIEKLCIEAALDVSNDNRAAAAQLLGLSRQGLYSKLHRYGLGPEEPS
jgi:transcriptional regulator PpsR